MAGYSRKELQIIGGNFTLDPPVDKVPIRDYLLCQNFRVDRVGQLISRYGYDSKFSIPGAGLAHSVGLSGGVEGDWYVAANGGSSGNGVYYDFNPTPIATGFDGGRVGFCYMNFFMYVMNQGKQGKHNAAQGWQPWGPPAAPLTACSAAVGSADPTGPSGTYKYYVTFQLSDLTLESNPGPASAPVTLALQDANLTAIPVCPAPAPSGLYWVRNIYATGGTLGQAYLVGTISNNTATTFTVSVSDATATNAGVVMPTTNDAPPAAAGMCGPYFSRLIAWATKANPSRLFWTDPNLPQYWPGAANPSVGNWVDVGADGEQILWCTQHTNVLVIYKERTVWELVGDPDTGYLQLVTEQTSLVSQFAVCTAGSVDYLVGPGGLYRFNLDHPEDVTGGLRPLFTANLTNAGPLTPPGAILPGPSYLSNTGNAYYAALGYGMGKLYIAYHEQGGGGCMLVHADQGGWAYHRTGMSVTAAFAGFVFDGVNMVGLGRDAANNAVGYNLDDFRAWYTQDVGPTPITCVYQSHYEDCGLPDNQKNWLEIVVDCQLAGDTMSVQVGYDNGNTALSQVGTISTWGRTQTSFALGQDGVLAKNISVALYVAAAKFQVVIHNVYLYYYEEARLAMAASTIPLDLGLAKVKQCKELELDIDASGGAVHSNLYSDLPGNALAVRQTPVIAKNGRAMWRYPFPVTEGYLWRVALTATAGPFRLYGARLLMRPVGVYVEAYESAAGFVWDSMETSFETLVTRVPRTFAIALAATPIKRFREISLEIETFNGNVTLNFLTDLPGNIQASRYTATVNTGASGRRFYRIPLPNGAPTPWIEGRLCRLQLSGAAKYILYEAAVEMLPVGVYIEAYEAAGGAIYDSRELDLGGQNVKQFRELELDIQATGAYTVTVYTDMPGHAMAVAATSAQSATTTRVIVQIPLPQGAVPDNYIFGRLVRVVISSASSFILYGARIDVRPIGLYVETYEAAGGAVWDSTPLDLGSPQDKQFDQVRFEMDSDGASNVAVYTDLPGEAFALRSVAPLTVAATARRWITVTMPAGANSGTWGVEGRSIRLIVSSVAGFRIYKAQVRHARVGRYLAAAAGDALSTLEFDWQSERTKAYKQVEIDMSADGTVTLSVLTSQSGPMAVEYTTTLTTPTGRQPLRIHLPPGLRGRLLRLMLTSASAARIFRLRVWARPLNEAQAQWTWLDYPLEESDVLPAWTDIPVPETPAQFTWTPLPVNPTPPGSLSTDPAQWQWGKFLQVEDTPQTWTWVDVPFEVSGS